MDQNPLSELTLRAVLSGLVVGCLIGASNVTIGLKIGWTFGAGITFARTEGFIPAPPQPVPRRAQWRAPADLSVRFPHWR